MLAGLDRLSTTSVRRSSRAYIKDTAPKNDVDRIQLVLHGMPQVTEVNYVSKEQALADFQQRQRATRPYQLPAEQSPAASLEINLRDPSDYLDVANYLRAQTSSVD